MKALGVALLAIDPGVKRSGWAIFNKEGVLTKCDHQDNEELEAWLELTAYESVIEMPRVYGGRSAKGDTQDLLTLAYHVARFSILTGYTTLVHPQEWKGQVPKDVCARRVLSRLTEAEHACIPELARTRLHNVHDVIGNAGRLFSPPLPSANATRQTAHSLPAFERPWQERLLQVLLCNTLEDTFYAAKRDMLEETKAGHEHAITTDIDFYAAAFAYARSKGLVRTQPIYGLALLATRSDLDVASKHFDDSFLGDARRKISLFESVFTHVIKTPNDLIDFHGIVACSKAARTAAGA
jgi:hypothetical protein